MIWSCHYLSLLLPAGMFTLYASDILSIGVAVLGLAVWQLFLSSAMWNEMLHEELGEDFIAELKRREEQQTEMARTGVAEG